MVGVDISKASIAIAKEKAEKEAVDVTLIHHDIDSLKGSGIEEGYFDVIICVLLEDPAIAVREWARFLKPQGKIIFDVLTNKTSIVGYVLEVVAERLHMSSVPHQRMKFSSPEAVCKLLVDARLNADESFLSEDDGGRTLAVENAAELFVGMVQQSNWFEWAYGRFQAPDIQAAARNVFCKKLNAIADDNGKIQEELRFHVGVGKKEI